MTYSLSTHVILNTMHALAAVQALACGDGERAILAPMLRRERTPLQALLVKNAFVEVVMRLGPLVADTTLGDETATSPGGDAADPEAESLDCLLTVELLTPASFSTARHGIVRRALEQSVALTALSQWCRAACRASDAKAAGVAASLADGFATVATEWYDTLAATLACTLRPCIRPGYPQ